MIFSVVVGLCILNSLFDASFSLHTPAAGWKLLGCVCSFSISPAGGAKLTQTDCSCGEETLLLISQIQAIYHLTTSITITLPYQLNITNQSSIDHVYVCRTAAVARQAVSGLCDVTDFGRGFSAVIRISARLWTNTLIEVCACARTHTRVGGDVIAFLLTDSLSEL